MRKLIDKIGGRKFTTALMLVAMSTAFLFMNVGEIDFQKWGDFVKWVFIGYVGANSAHKLSKNSKL